MPSSHSGLVCFIHVLSELCRSLSDWVVGAAVIGARLLEGLVWWARALDGERADAEPGLVTRNEKLTTEAL